MPSLGGTRPIPFDTPKNGQATSPDDFAEVAPAGPDGAKVLELLAQAKKRGAATLGHLTRQAVSRLLGRDQPATATKLFNASERQQLATMIAATNATAELLGRARIRRRLAQAERHYAEKSGSASDKPKAVA